MNLSVQRRLNKFFSKYPKKNYPKGQILIYPEDSLDYIYSLHSGYVKSYSLNDKGVELIINIYRPYDFFPITETLAEIVNTYYFSTVSTVTVFKAPSVDVHKFIKNDNEVLFDLAKRISIGLEGFMVRTQYLIRSNSLQKVASSLVLLARRFGKRISTNKITILIEQTHEDIANLSGLARETTSNELQKLRKKKIINIKNQIYTINNFDKLLKLSTIYYEGQPLPFKY